MTYQEYIAVLRDEIQVLSQAERDEIGRVLDSEQGNLICMALWPFEKSGRLSSVRFKSALEGLYWLSR
jgi:hypothetical protein